MITLSRLAVLQFPWEMFGAILDTVNWDKCTSPPVQSVQNFRKLDEFVNGR